MKSFRKIFTAVILLIIMIFTFANLWLINTHTDSGRPYIVEISRISREIEENGLDSINLADYSYITDIEVGGDIFFSESDYAVREINGEIYRFDYTVTVSDNGIRLKVNIILAVMSAVIVAVLFYIYKYILLPFDKLKNVPYELSKGNLITSVKENKSRFFGKFVWGLDLLRENIEQQKRRELDLQRERKTLLLSLSHDIKTPLSAIKLYAKALSKGLYSEIPKQKEIAENINRKADEIESFVSQIVNASREDFLSLDVNVTEFYLNEFVNKINEYYSEKMKLTKTDFVVGNFSDCLIKGDFDRSIEVLQNVVENAVKYGDGKKICMNFSEEDNCLLISISNSGCSLPDNELVHIFDSFWRGSNTDGISGSGLGLYICRQLMHKMNGEIFANSDNDIITVSIAFTKS